VDVKEVKELLRTLNSAKYGFLLDYMYDHRKGTVGEKMFCKFLKDNNIEPIEVVGKEIEIKYESPVFRLGVYSCSHTTISWGPGDVKKFRVCSPGWRYKGEQIIPIEVYPIE